ncbi:MAG TPA: lytic transglycosylase domain-containing protein [Aestuariivirgaceae bacterium]|nr:lytic transglycosylase domain-containing protein [Aestuariivirgaceae bacterium]
MAEGRGLVQRSVLALAVMLVGTAVAAAQPRVPGPSGPREAAESAQVSTCDLIEDAAAASGLPVDYFTRLIWRESSFRPWVISPVGAQGIAQFMPGTAAERGLLDPFDPLQAIPASARLLVSLAQRFGNLGLAAAAYNAGPRRVEKWLAGTGGMPRETRDYVANVTGRTVEEWRDAPGEMDDEIVWDVPETPPTCTDVLAALDAPALSDAALQSPGVAVEWQPWGVQVAGNFSQSRALASWRSLQQRHPDVLGDREPLIVRKQNRSLGTRPMINVRIPAPTRETANDLCRQLRDEGAACIVLKN